MCIKVLFWNKNLFLNINIIAAESFILIVYSPFINAQALLSQRALFAAKQIDSHTRMAFSVRTRSSD